MAVMMNAANPQALIELNETQIAARMLNLRLQSIQISAEASFENAFEKLINERVQALILLTDAMSMVTGVELWRWPQRTAYQRCISSVNLSRRAV